MNGTEFTRTIRKIGKRNGVTVTVEASRGKGSHETIYYGARFTVVKHSEIGPGLLAKLLRDLDLTKRDIRR